MEKCFVIQPFDNSIFDKRYKDIFEPAILNSGLEPYRIDRDFSVRIPIEEIEREIRGSAICFAEITMDNPNVWYELGFSFACDKDVVMVCSEERQGKFPFDIQHKHIIKYQTGSTSDYTMLGENITKKIRAMMQRTKTVLSLNDVPILEMEGLKSHEVALLILIIENSISPDESVSIYRLKSQMNDAGYTDVATSVGIRTLNKYHMIETFMENDGFHNQDYTVCRLTPKGEQWIFDNENHLQFRTTKPSPTENDELRF